MKLVLLLEDKLNPIPDTIKVLEDWGFVSVVNGWGKPLVSGSHVYLEGTEEAFKEWLRPFDSVCVGQGSPMLQNFSIMHIKWEN